jgi:hypothetical protein
MGHDEPRFLPVEIDGLLDIPPCLLRCLVEQQFLVADTGHSALLPLSLFKVFSKSMKSLSKWALDGPRAIFAYEWGRLEQLGTMALIQAWR